MRRHILLLLTLLALASAAAPAQQILIGESPEQAASAARVMALITPELMRLAQHSDFFLRLADQIQLSDLQRTALEEIAYAHQIYKGRKLADLGLNEAELEWLLKRERINFDAVRAKLAEAAAITVDMKM